MSNALSLLENLGAKILCANDHYLKDDQGSTLFDQRGWWIQVTFKTYGFEGKFEDTKPTLEEAAEAVLAKAHAIVKPEAFSAIVPALEAPSYPIAF